MKVELDFVALANEYVDSKKLAWARTSQKNERARLRKHGCRVLDEPALVYVEFSKKMKPYSIKCTFVRLNLFYKWLMDNDKIPITKNPWRAFMDTHALLFKHIYQPERLTVDYDEARQRIENMEEPWKSAALQMLESGMRYCELRTFDGLRVIGKGNKPRKVYMSEELSKFRYTGSYTALYVRIKAVGLKPHSLRKLCATEFYKQPGANDIDLCEVFGWDSIETSIKYRQPKREDHLRRLLHGIVANAKFKKKVEA